MVTVQVPDSIVASIHQAEQGARVKAWARSESGGAWLRRFHPEPISGAGQIRARKGTKARRAEAVLLRKLRVERVRRAAEALASAMAEGRRLAAEARRAAQLAEAERRLVSARSVFKRQAGAERLAGVVVTVPAWGGRSLAAVEARRLTLGERAERLAERLRYWRAAERLGGSGAGACRARRLRIGRELREVRRELRRLAAAWFGEHNLERGALARARRLAAEAREVRRRNQGRGVAPSLAEQLARHPLGRLAAAAAEHAARSVEGGQLTKAKRLADVAEVGSKPATKRWGAARTVVESGDIRPTPGRGVVSDASRSEAIGAALAAAWAECVRLAGRRGSAERLAEVPAWVPGEVPTPAARRRGHLFRVARRAAFADLTRLPAGFTGARGKLWLVELTEWGRGADGEAEGEAAEAFRFRPLAERPAASFEFLPPSERGAEASVAAAQRLAARQRLFTLCGSPCPVVRAGRDWNRAEATWSARRRFDFLSLVLAGEGWGEAARLAGWKASGEGLVRNCLKPALALVGLRPEAVGVPWDSKRGKFTAEA